MTPDRKARKTGLLVVLAFFGVVLFIVWFLVSTIIERNRPRQQAAAPVETVDPVQPIAIPEVVEPGLQLTFQTADRAASDSRLARMVALHVPRRSTPSPFLPAGPFLATWKGFVDVPLRDRFDFRAEGKGGLSLEINGVTALDGRMDPERPLEVEGIELQKGANAILVRFTSDTLGEATLRLYWSSAEISIEPVPPTVLSHDPAQDDLQAGLSRRRGRDLLAARRCVRCHEPEQPLDSATAMPELSADAPSWVDIGSRLNRQWMARWILDPPASRRHATMPALFPGGTEADRQAARDIAAYLSTLGEEPPLPPQYTGFDVEEGAYLFQELGCTACHVAPDGDPSDVALGDRIHLGHVRAKWKPAALQEFLEQPRQYYRWTRMPDFLLAEEEASALAAYLLDKSPEESEPRSEADVDRGRELAQGVGCVNCHDTGLDELGLTPAEFPGLGALVAGDGGCLAEDPGPAPDFALGPGEVRDLTAFLEGGTESLRRRSSAEFATRQLRARRCTACHDRDGSSSIWSQALERDIESLDPELQVFQVRPSLTWVGEKLRPEWMRAFISGELDTPRPWLVSRMPAFPVVAGELVQGLASQHGRSTDVAPPEEPNASLAATGRRLVVDGFSCILCHGLGESMPTSRFEVEGINFALVTERLRKDYFLRWMADPPRTEPGSRMPRYANSEGRTGLTDIFDGDARRQFDAMWHYLLAGWEIR